MNTPTPLSPDYSLDDVATALGMSTRWVRDRIKAGERGDLPHVDHIRRGHKIRFTADQVEALRMDGAQTAPASGPITTGPKRRRTA